MPTSACHSDADGRRVGARVDPPLFPRRPCFNALVVRRLRRAFVVLA